jgi:hypothetical protein
MTLTPAELAVLKRYDHALDGILHAPDIKEQRKLERRKRANRKYRERMREALNRIRREKKARANVRDQPGRPSEPPQAPQPIDPPSAASPCWAAQMQPDTTKE